MIRELRITLNHSTVGSKTISVPEGWKNLTIGTERHPTFFSLVEFFRSDFSLYGSNGVQDGGRDFVKAVQLIGVDEELNVLAEISNNKGVFTTLFEGLLPIQAITEVLDLGDDLQVTFTPASFWAKFLSRYDVAVDIQTPDDLDGNAVEVLTPETINLTSQAIPMTTSYKGHSGADNTNDDCYIATTANITLSGHQTIDGVLTTELMRVLVKDQTDAKENGIYEASSVAWSRAADANIGAELEDLFVAVTNGTLSAGLAFKQTTKPVTIGVDNIVFVETDYVTSVTDIYNKGFNVSALQISFNPGWQQITKEYNLQELTDSFLLPPTIIVDLNRDGAINDVFNILELNKVEGLLKINIDMDINLRISGRFTASTDYPTEILVECKLIIKVNDGAEVNDATVDFDYLTGIVAPGTDVVFNSGVLSRNLTLYKEINVKRSDLVYAYLKYEVTTFQSGTTLVTYNQLRLSGGFIRSDNVFQLESTFPDTTAEGFLNHDVFHSIFRRIAGVPVYSKYLGSPYTQGTTYAKEGAQWKKLLLRGLQLRGYALSDKIFSTSAKDQWEGADPVLNLGLGYGKNESGANCIIIEEKEKFFDNDNIAFTLSNVRKISKYYDQESLFNTLEVGYQKWEGSDTSSLDDPQTKRTLATVFRFVGKKLSLFSKWIAASETIEITRRTVVKNTADYKYDNDVFVIDVNRNSGDGTYNPVLDEQFVGVTNLLNEETRYNKMLTPYRNLLRYMNFIVGGLQNYISSYLKFTGGEGNYKMTSQTADATKIDSFEGNELAENQDIPIGGYDFIHRAELYRIDHKMTLEQYQAHQANRHYCFQLSQTKSNYTKFHIKTLEFKPFDGSVTIIAWSKEDFVIDNNPPINKDLGIFDYTFGEEFE